MACLPGKIHMFLAKHETIRYVGFVVEVMGAISIGLYGVRANKSHGICGVPTQTHLVTKFYF